METNGSHASRSQWIRDTAMYHELYVFSDWTT